MEVLCLIEWNFFEGILLISAHLPTIPMPRNLAQNYDWIEIDNFLSRYV